MKKPVQVALAVLAALVALPLVLVFAGFLAYQDNKLRCDPIVPVSRVEKEGLALPAGIKVCRATKRPGGMDFELLVDKPSPLCLAAFGAIGCGSPAKAGLAFVGPMADAGWDTGKIDGGKDGEAASFEFRKGRDAAQLDISRTRFGELRGWFRASSSKPAAKDDD